jgi:hypothetical protein
VVAHLGDPDAVLVLDETAFLKKGTKSVGVSPQYAGITGQTENCQVAVFLAYATPYGRALIDFALYLGKYWAGDIERCKAAGVPADRRKRVVTKPELGILCRSKIRFGAVTCADVVGSGGVLVLVDHASEDGLSSNPAGLEVGDGGRGGRLVAVRG